jgi:hypothetical protein
MKSFYSLARGYSAYLNFVCVYHMIVWFQILMPYNNNQSDRRFGRKSSVDTSIPPTKENGTTLTQIWPSFICALTCAHRLTKLSLRHITDVYLDFLRRDLSIQTGRVCILSDDGRTPNTHQ